MSIVGGVGRRTWQIAIALLLVVALAVAGYLGFQKATHRTYSGYFSSVTGLYSGDAVRVLGVDIGKVTAVTARPGGVKVDMEVDRGTRIPANASAIIVAQSLVSGRFVQLSPVYAGGPTLAAGADIPMDRTAVPIEWDDIKKQLTRLTEAVGPQGADPGSVSRTVDTAAANLDGNGGAIRDSLHQLSDVVSTLSNGRDDLFGTIRNLQKLTDALSQSHDQLVAFNGRIASVSQVLADNSSNLDGALKNLDSALSDVKSFIDTNAHTLTESVQRLSQATSILAQKDEQIRGLLHSAPTQLSNFYNIYNPLTGSLSGIFGLGMGGNLIDMLCGTMSGDDRPGNTAADVEHCVDVLTPVLSSIAVNYPPVLLNPVTGINARPGQIQYQDPDVRARARQGVVDKDAATRSQFAANPGLGRLLVPFGGQG
ncbi:MCE family protein [Williamsia sterculiae]|uniref:Phospholipid/cholesterol/gamma-HCH transport system substrate-binding protein n=1 Tax=Williamsia sterculiae TaxID=1344003 RepID=A0A1N7CSU6_9NOCA|nr:MCE family protein [Williamsia sterculiae]SIR66557.1 phospholipid/cholesterol/gamma-HCH transport system substrate-binding protein [Williamsia sterculiae]